MNFHEYNLFNESQSKRFQLNLLLDVSIKKEH